jgi:hypothetical protein
MPQRNDGRPTLDLSTSCRLHPKPLKYAIG